MATLSVDTLTIQARSVSILDSVSFSVGNEILGIVGPNGSGKTTLLRAIASGEHNESISFGGSDSGEHKVGYLPQKVRLPKRLRVREFLEYAAWIKDVRPVRERAASTIANLELGSFAERPISKVSGGVEQRTAFGSVLISEPDVLLLDEPTTGVDIHQREVMRSLIAHHGRGRTTILSSHIAEDIEMLCDRVLVLVGGRVRFLGSISEAVNATGVNRFGDAVSRLSSE